MTGRGVVLLAAAVALLTALGALTLLNARAVPDEEVARRVAVSQPSWDNYPEDIKGQIGAALVAQWAGAPVAADVEGGRLRVTFAIHGPWAHRKTAIPILLRDPFGTTRQSGEAAFPESEPGTAVYFFNLNGEVESVRLPWVEMKYPHGERRLVLDGGHWKTRD